MPFLPARGRPATPVLFEVLGELTAADLGRLALEAGPRVAVPPIQRVREIHRKQAELVAQGLSFMEIAARCDTTPQRLTQLMDDPSFTNLVEYFRVQTEEVRIAVTERVLERYTDITELASDEIQRRLEDPAERAKMSIDELRRLQESAGDRSITPPRTAEKAQQPPVSITFTIPGGRKLKDEREVVEGEFTTIDPESAP